MKPEVIALVDCNSFYCSCERVFRPDLKKSPIVVLSNNDGCAVSRTPEAKALGVKMGQPYFQFKDLCTTHGLQVFSANFSLYTNFSDRVMNTLKKLSPNVEVYSVDEAFMDLSGLGDPARLGEMIKKRVERDTAIPVGIGIGPTKVLAKAANRLVKMCDSSNGVLSLMDESSRLKYLKELPVEDIWGIGRANTPKMKSLGIRNAYDLAQYKNEKLIQKIFTKIGLSIKHELMGIPCFEFNAPINPKKEIMCSRTFGETIVDLEVLKQVIANYVTDAAEKLRSQESLCQEVTVFARTNPFNNDEQYYLHESKKIPTPTLDTRKLIKSAHELLLKGYKEGIKYKKAGVKLSSFYSSFELQLDFFSEGDSEQDKKLMLVMDHINTREGDTLLKSGSCSTGIRAWKLNQDYKSPRYTTSWIELPEFK
jgi:DNA polymerase V